MSRYPELTGKVDAFFARVIARHGDQMACNTGCSQCCHVRLTVTGVEAQAIRDEIATWPADRRAALAANVAAAAPDRCVALDPGGRCLIYGARPLVCRSHGAPIKIRSYKSPRLERQGKEPGLKVYSTCGLNFTAGAIRSVDPDCVLDQETVSTMLIAVDRDAGNDGSRTDLADVIAGSPTR